MFGSARFFDVSFEVFVHVLHVTRGKKGGMSAEGKAAKNGTMA